MGMRRSLDAKIYYGPAGATATTELATVSDATVNDSYEKMQFQSRASQIKYSFLGARAIDLEFSIADDPNDAALQALNDAYNAGEPIALLVLDAVDGDGPDADWVIVERPRKESINDIIVYTFKVEPTYDTRHLVWHDAS